MRMRTNSVAAVIFGSLDCFFIKDEQKKESPYFGGEGVSYQESRQWELLAELLHQNLE